MDLKYNCLKNILAGYDSVLVSFSGGVDSTLLLRAAVEEVGDHVLAVTFAGDLHSPAETAEAAELACSLGVEYLHVEHNVLKNTVFAGNPPDRCYHCKKEMYGRLTDLARERGINVVADGANADDAGDYRPGLRAARETGVISPLLEAGLGKEEIRALSRKLGLPTADKPASPCLATRFPYGMEISPEALKQVGAAEAIIRAMGIPEARVRHHGDLARIEVPGQYRRLILEKAAEAETGLKALGYVYVALDLRGYRTGSMNETLKL